LKRMPDFPRRLLIEELEPRILFSADLAPTVLDTVPAVAEQRVLDAGGEFMNQADQAQVQHATTEVVFVDTRVSNYQQLIDDIKAGENPDRQIDIVILDPNKDGISQITATLSHYGNLDAVHLISHGTDGSVQLGSTSLNFDTLFNNATQIQDWSNALSANADILLYGCDVAENDDGKALVDALASLTGADVAASTDLTGNTAKGGDWSLEYRTGLVQTPVALGAWGQQSWNGVLATYTVTNTNDSGAGSLRQAMLDANSNTGADTINFNIAGSGIHTISLTSALSTISDSVILDATTQSGYVTGAPVIVLDGTSAGAEANGFTLQASNSVIRGFQIQNFTNGTTSITGAGIVIDGSTGGGDNNTITENYLTANCESVTGSVGAIVITGAADNNVITVNQLINNNSDGIRFADALSTSNQLTNNVIIGSGDDGVKLVGANITFTGNTVSNNQRLSAGAAGIELASVTGTSLVANNTLTNDGAHGSEGGIWILDSTGITVANNTVSGFSGAGIAINATSTGIALTQNSIYSNGRLGIDLFPTSPQVDPADGVTPNDSGDGDSGANDLKNFPVLTSATINTATQVTITGTYDNLALVRSYRIEFFASPAGDASLHGEGQRYLGYIDVTTDSAGGASFSVVLSAAVTAGETISATATDLTLNETSEFSANVVATNSAPVLDASKSPVLGAINEDAGAPVGAVGTLVSNLVDFSVPAGQVDNVSDANTVAYLGIAVTGTDSSNGSWWYSTNGGTTWNVLGAVADNNARLLAADANTLIYFQPNANYNGTLASAITFRAWDQTSGANGSLADTSINGGMMAFSSATDTASLVVNPVNDAPVLAAIEGTALAYTENAVATAITGTLTVSDVDNANLASATVQITANYVNGEDVLSFTNTASITGSWNAATGTLTLSGSDTTANYQAALRSVKYSNSSDTPSTATRTVSFRVNDGATNSSAVTRNIAVTAVDDAPVISSNGGGASASVTVAENTTAVTTVTSSDVDGGAPVYSIVAGADGAKFTINAGTGVLSFITSPDYENPTDVGGNNIYDVTMRVSDGAGGTDTQAIAVTVSAVNDNTPAITSNGGGATASVNVAENTTAVTTVTATDADLPAQTLTYSISGGADAAKFAVNSSTGALNFVAAPNYEAPTDSGANNVYDVIVQVSDGSLTDTQAIAVTVTNVNEAPSGTDKTVNSSEDTVLTLTAANFGFTDTNDSPANALQAVKISTLPGAGTLMLSGVALIAGQSISIADINAGLLQFTPSANANGSGYASFTFQVQDDGGTANGGIDTDPTPNTITVDVNPVNDAPTTTPVTLAQIAEDSGARLITQTELLANATDVDGPSLTATGLAISSGSGSLVDKGDGTWTYTPALNDDTAVSFSYSVSDGSLTTVGSATLDITPVNDAPTASDITINATEDTLYSGNLPVATDVEGDTVTYALGVQAANGAVVVNADGSFIYTPTANYNGSDSFAYTVSDGNGGTSTYAVTVNVAPVNDAPSVAPVNLGNINEDNSRLITQAELLSGASDVEGDPLTVMNLVLTTGNGALVDNSNGTWTFTPDADWNGAVSFGFEVSDGNATTSNTANLMVNPVNDAPLVSPVTLGSVNEDNSLVITQANLLAGASDVDGDTLTAINLTLTAGNGSLIDNANGTWTFVPNADWNGNVAFSFDVSDGTTSTANTASLAVNPVNDAPTTTPVTLAPIAEDSGTRLITQAELLANASDVDGPSLSATGLTIASGNGSLVGNGDGTWTYTPAANDDTAVSFSYSVNDSSLTAAGSASLDITPVNDAPVANDDSATANEDTAITGNVLTNDTDIDSVSLTATLVSGPANGSLLLNSDGSYTYSPNANWNGSDSFTYTANDGSLNSNVATVSITVNAVNDAPIANNDSVTTNEDAPITSNVVANDMDVEGDTLTVSAVTQGANGTVSFAGGTVTYTPNANWNGTDSFTYTVSDGNGGFASAAVSVTVNPVNDAPAVVPITLGNINEDSSRLITQSDLLAGTTDVDGGPLTAINLALVSGNGTLVDNLDGTWSFNPASNWNGNVSFTFDVSDGFAVAANTAALIVSPVNDAPTAADATLSMAENTNYSGSLPVAGDAEGDPITYALTTGAANGTAIVNADGSFSYTPNANFYGTDSFTYLANDGALDSNIATITFTVKLVDAPLPVAPIDPVSPGGAGEAPVPQAPASEPVLPPPSSLPAMQPILASELPADAVSQPALVGLDQRVHENTGDASLHSSPFVPFDRPHTIRHEALTNPDQQGDRLLQVLNFLRVNHEVAVTEDNIIAPGTKIDFVQDDNFKVDIFTAGVRITAVSLSVGAVWWALRAGGLTTSLLASLPAWKSFDVLPVLNSEAEDDDLLWESGGDEAYRAKRNNPEIEDDEVFS
jgi:VCBS repeat-containing protein/parallel beta-helix repeat protein